MSRFPRGRYASPSDGLISPATFHLRQFRLRGGEKRCVHDFSPLPRASAACPRALRAVRPDATPPRAHASPPCASASQLPTAKLFDPEVQSPRARARMQTMQLQQRARAVPQRATASVLPSASPPPRTSRRAQAWKKRTALLTKSPADGLVSPVSHSLHQRRTRGRPLNVVLPLRTTTSILPSVPLEEVAARGASPTSSGARAAAWKKRSALLTKSPADALMSPVSIGLQRRRTRARGRPALAAPPQTAAAPLRLASFTFDPVASESFSIPPPPPPPRIDETRVDEENAGARHARSKTHKSTPRRSGTPSASSARVKSLLGSAARSSRKARALTPRTNTPRRLQRASGALKRPGLGLTADGVGKSLLSLSLGGGENSVSSR